MATGYFQNCTIFSRITELCMFCLSLFHAFLTITGVILFDLSHACAVNHYILIDTYTCKHMNIRKIGNGLRGDIYKIVGVI